MSFFVSLYVTWILSIWDILSFQKNSDISLKISILNFFHLASFPSFSCKVVFPISLDNPKDTASEPLGVRALFPPPRPSLCKLFLIALGKTRHREVEMKIRCVPSVWLSVTPHLENPGYAFVTVSKLNNCVPSSHHKGSLFKEWYRMESRKIKQQQRKRISTSCNVTKATLIKITIHLHLVEWYRTGKRYFCQE